MGLRDDIFAFLAGVWTRPNEEASDSDNQQRVIALSHAAAYLEANILQEEASAVDFQTILPSLVVALGTLDAHGRRAALECIVLMLTLTSKKFVVVYAMDTIYGSDSGMKVVLRICPFFLTLSKINSSFWTATT